MSEQFYRINGPWPGRLAIVPRPRGGDWLEDEVRSHSLNGVHAMVSLLTADEVDEFDLQEEPQLCSANGIEFVSFPMPDRGVPSSQGAMLKLAKKLNDSLRAGKTIGIHCRQGIGRSSLVGACLLALTGVPVQTAFEQIGAARGWPVPETPQQRKWAEAFAANLAAAVSERL